MIEYKTEISTDPSLLHPRRISVVTTGTSRERDRKRYLTEYFENTSRQFPSPEELRRSLVREKFHTDVQIIFGYLVPAVASLVIGFSFFVQEKPIIAGITTGIAFYMVGDKIRQAGLAKKAKVDSIVSAFNTTFPDLQPIRFNPRDYLSTFLQRKSI